jgi:hypothetical protein
MCCFHAQAFGSSPPGPFFLLKLPRCRSSQKLELSWQEHLHCLGPTTGNVRKNALAWWRQEEFMLWGFTVMELLCFWPVIMQMNLTGMQLINLE